MLIPINFEFSSDIETARIDFPRRVLDTKRSSITKTIIGMIIARTVSIRISAPPTVPKLHFSRTRGAAKGRESVIIRTPSKRNIDTPIAEIREASLFAPRARSLRYATTSTSMATTAQTTMETTSAASSTSTNLIPRNCSDSVVILKI